ncbi:MAG: hypothetical protein LBS34_00335 [Rickettsiales bacterium]|jgi:hypothetical protein|nr:hypothetical protein [Rickettsiales bacterium]
MAEIEFRGAASVRLASCIAKNLHMFYGLRSLSIELYNRYNQETFALFLKQNLKKEEFLTDFVDLTDLNEDEVNLIMSFAKNSDNIKYTPPMVSALDVKNIKEIIKKVLHALFNLDFYFLNRDIEDQSLDLQEKWKECAKGGNPNIELRDMVNL